MHRRSITKGNEEAGHRKQIRGATALLKTIGRIYNKSRAFIGISGIMISYNLSRTFQGKKERREEKTCQRYTAQS